MERDLIKIPPIQLKWSDWFPWDDLKKDARKDGVKVPNKKPGIYEVKYKDCDEQLTIGKASDLRYRVKQCLIKGKSGHPAGEKIRSKEDISKIVVRWAVTARPAAVEEELHKRYKRTFGELPQYVEFT